MSSLACAATSVIRPVAYHDVKAWRAMLGAVTDYIGRSLNEIMAAHEKQDNGRALALSVRLCEEFAIPPCLWDWQCLGRGDLSAQQSKKIAALAEEFCTDRIDIDGWDPTDEDDEDDEEDAYSEIRKAFDPPILYESDGTCGDDGPEVL